MAKQREEKAFRRDSMVSSQWGIPPLLTFVALFQDQVIQQAPLQLSWKKGSDMPFEMGDYVQSGVIEKEVYIGGGWAGTGNNNNYVVMVYNIESKKWATLPPYKTDGFALAVIDNHLLLVGGVESSGSESKVLGVWEPVQNLWTHPYKEMPTARRLCSAVVSDKWLVVAGGVTEKKRVSSVEVLNTSTNEWYTAPPTPTPWSSMKTAVVGNLGFFMGGVESEKYSTKVYCLDIQTLISHITSKASSGKDSEMWKEIPELNLIWSAPLQMGRSLLSVGGNSDANAVPAIYLYQIDANQWVRIGDLPFSRYHCACTMISDTDMLVAGGRNGQKHPLNKVDFATFS